MSSGADAALACWVVSDGRRGIENQALGLAEALGRLTPVDISVRRISVKEPWRSLPRAVWGDPHAHLDKDRSSLLRPPYPDVWIAAGRLSVPFSIAAKRAEGGPFVVQTQDPRARVADFDLVVPPHHDGLVGENVFSILGSPNRLSMQTIEDDAARLAPRMAHLPSPRAAVLIGGDSKAHRLSPARIEEICDDLRRLAASGVGLMATTSRRTPPNAAKRILAALVDAPAYVWMGEPVAGLENPFFGFLGLADHILVTEDSTNMATEAAATGKPVHVIPLDGGSTKFDLFHRQLRRYGAARWFTGDLESWSYTPLRETDRAAAELLARLRARRRAPVAPQAAATS